MNKTYLDITRKPEQPDKHKKYHSKYCFVRGSSPQHIQQAHRTSEVPILLHRSDVIHLFLISSSSHAALYDRDRVLILDCGSTRMHTCMQMNWNERTHTGICCVQ